jgi:hypothetical protein
MKCKTSIILWISDANIARTTDSAAIAIKTSDVQSIITTLTHAVVRFEEHVVGQNDPSEHRHLFFRRRSGLKRQVVTVKSSVALTTCLTKIGWILFLDSANVLRVCIGALKDRVAAKLAAATVDARTSNCHRRTTTFRSVRWKHLNDRLEHRLNRNTRLHRWLFGERDLTGRSLFDNKQGIGILDFTDVPFQLAFVQSHFLDAGITESRATNQGFASTTTGAFSGVQDSITARLSN